MPAISFTRWIRQQTRRDDAIGDLARDIGQDRCWPGRARSRQAYLEHLVYHHEASRVALVAFEKAYEEWLTEVIGDADELLIEESAGETRPPDATSGEPSRKASLMRQRLFPSLSTTWLL